MKIIVGSTNRVKIEATRAAFQAMFPDTSLDIEGVSVPSDIPEQPWGHDQTRSGAKNRVINAAHAYPGADFYVSNESGLIDEDGQVYTINWVAVYDGKTVSCSAGTFYPLPPKISQMVRSGMELNPAFIAHYGEEATKLGAGGIGKMTHGVVPRESLVYQAIVTALMPFTNRELFELPQTAAAAA